MIGRKLIGVCAILAAGVAVAVTSFAAAEPSKDAKPTAIPEMKLPPGWTEADVQACMAAATPGKMQAHLATDVGAWAGKNTMWMGPGAEPVTTDCTSTVSPMLDGRYVTVEMAGEMPGMGPYNGFGINGFDNVSQKFVSTWIDNHSTGIMNGTGVLSADGKTMTWTYSYTCPVNKKPSILRQVETTAAGSKVIEMFGTEPKSGQEYKMMRIELSKK